MKINKRIRKKEIFSHFLNNRVNIIHGEILIESKVQQLNEETLLDFKLWDINY